MDNLSFVKRFIAGTKQGVVQWSEATDPNSPAGCEGFSTKKGNNFLIIMHTENDVYILLIFEETGHEVYRIDENNLLYDLDGESIPSWNAEDEHALSRLFRLAERSAKQIDSLLNRLVSDLPDEDPILPF